MIVSLDDNPDVVAVVPTLGSKRDRLRGCLESIQQSVFEGRLAVIVVWNDPRQSVPDLGLVTILEPGLNLGFPIALNAARGLVAAPFLWVVQDDQTVAVDCLQVLVDRIDQSDQPAIVSPVIINEEGLIPARSRGGFVREDGIMDQWFPSADCNPNELDQDLQIDWVALSGALLRCETWDEVGGMDPMFFPLLWSDVDLGYRMKKIGRRSVLEPRARVTHQRNGSTPSLLARFLNDRNRDYFETKHVHGATQSERTTAIPSDDATDSVALIAREASLLLIDFAEQAEKELRAQKELPLEIEQPVPQSLMTRLRRFRQR